MATVSGTVTDKSGNVAPWSVNFTVGGTPSASMLVGASNAVTGGNDPVPFESAMGLTTGQKLDLFRCYDDAGPAATWGGTDFGQYVGNRGMWWSCKGDIDDWANPNGTNITRAKALAASYNPAWPKMYWTIWHEVQPKLVDRTFTFQQFKAAWTTFYNAVRPIAPPNVSLAVIHGGFGWRVGSTETTVSSSTNPYAATPAEWLTLPVDFKAIDNYGGPQVEDILWMARFQRFVKEMAGGDLSQVGIAESGMRQSSLANEQEGIDWVKRQGDQLGDATMPRPAGITGALRAWCVWNSSKTVDPGPMTTAQTRAFGDVWRKYSPNR